MDSKIQYHKDVNSPQMIYRLMQFQSKLKRDILLSLTSQFKNIHGGFPGGAVVENLPANAGNTGSSPGLGRSHMPWSN